MCAVCEFAMGRTSIRSAPRAQPQVQRLCHLSLNTNTLFLLGFSEGRAFFELDDLTDTVKMKEKVLSV